MEPCLPNHPGRMSKESPEDSRKSPENFLESLNRKEHKGNATKGAKTFVVLSGAERRVRGVTRSTTKGTRVHEGKSHEGTISDFEGKKKL